MARINLSGMGVALITPFKEDESIDFEALSRLIEYLIQNGTDYLVVLGTTAETPTLTEEEKTEIKRFVVERTKGRIPLVLGLGGNNTRGIIDLSLIHISEPTRQAEISYAVFCLKKKKKKNRLST